MNEKDRKHIKKLMRDSGYRRECGLYIAEGVKIAAEAEAGLIESVVVTDSFLCSPQALSCGEVLEKEELTVVSEREMSALSDTVTPQGILLVMRMREYRGLGEFLPAEKSYRERLGIGEPLLLILESIQDPGNLGTIIRSAEAAGASGVIGDMGTADIYSPKVVRSAMGSVMRLPYLRTQVPAAAAGQLRERGIAVYAAAPQAAQSYWEAELSGPVCFMIGNESRGLSAEMLGAACGSLAIPMASAVDSLNAASAATLLLYEAARRRIAQNTLTLI